MDSVFKIKGSFYEMSKMIHEVDVQEGYHVEKEVSQEMKDSVEGHLEFKKVNFAYPVKPEVPVLKDISIKVANNQIIALVG